MDALCSFVLNMFHSSDASTHSDFDTCVHIVFFLFFVFNFIVLAFLYICTVYAVYVFLLWIETSKVRLGFSASKAEKCVNSGQFKHLIL